MTTPSDPLEAPPSESDRAGRPGMSIRSGSADPLIDEPVPVLLDGFEPGSTVTVRAAVDIAGELYHAEGVYRASATGSVNTATDPSVAGTYQGIDPYGLWWSGTATGPGTAEPLAAVGCRMYASSGSDGVEMMFHRHWLRPGTTVSAVSEPGIWGQYVKPPGVGPFPGVVAFGGSGGGLGPAAIWAPLLAGHGIATLAIGYFAGPGLPAALINIGIEAVERAAHWLLGRAEIAGERVAVVGVSRGSELALWAAALLDNVAATVAYSPSGISWCGLDTAGPVDAPAWSFRGKSLPYAFPRSEGAPIAGGHGPIALRRSFEPAIANAANYQHAEIPVEDISGPVLLVSGEADAMWPSSPMGALIERRAAAHNVSRQFTHLHYPEAGHLVAGPPGIPTPRASRHPVTGEVYDYGGTAAGTANARADSWPKIINCLAQVPPGTQASGGGKSKNQ